MTGKKKVEEVVDKLDGLRRQHFVSFPLSTPEQVWEEAGVEYDCVGSGCGSVEYQFPNKYARDRAITIYKKHIFKYTWLIDKDGELVKNLPGE